MKKTMIAILLSLIVATTAFASTKEIVGDSLTVGVSQIIHADKVVAKVGMSSCWIANRAPIEQYDVAILSAGTNDPPGRCVEKLRNKIHASKVIWIVPVNGARQHVLSVAASHGDSVAYYTPGKRSWPHPNSYRPLAETIKSLT